MSLPSRPDANCWVAFILADWLSSRCCAPRLLPIMSFSSQFAGSAGWPHHHMELLRLCTVDERVRDYGVADRSTALTPTGWHYAPGPIVSETERGSQTCALQQPTWSGAVTKLLSVHPAAGRLAASIEQHHSSGSSGPCSPQVGDLQWREDTYRTLRGVFLCMPTLALLLCTVLHGSFSFIPVSCGSSSDLCSHLYQSDPVAPDTLLCTACCSSLSVFSLWG